MGNEIGRMINHLKSEREKEGCVVLRRKNFNVPIDNIPIMSKATKVVIMGLQIKDANILQFKKWCPNVTELCFVRVEFSQEIFDDFRTIIGEMPGVKTLTFTYQNTMENLVGFLEQMDEIFPSLEQLTMILKPTDDVDGLEQMWDDSQPHQSIYFNNLKKLSLKAFGDVFDRIFNYMNICDENLEDFKFTAFSLSEENIDWINDCKHLVKLTLKVPAMDIGQRDINRLKGLEHLKEFHLKMDKLNWQPMQMMEFIRNNKRLVLISIKAKSKNKNLKFYGEFTKMFYELVEERGDIQIIATIGSGEAQRWVHISKSGTNETLPSVGFDSDFNDEEQWFQWRRRKFLYWGDLRW